MRVIGLVGKIQLHILIDTESTNNFLNTSVAKKVGCKVKATCPLQVTIAGGETLVSDTMCIDFVWRLQRESFSASVMLLPLGGYDMVLGVKWLSTLGDIKFNFQDLRMTFAYKGKTMILRGSTKPVVQWMNGKQASSSEKQSKNLAMCVYPTSMLQMMSPNNSTQHSSGMPNTPSELNHLIVEFVDVFEIPICLPPKRSHDHKIPLKDGTQPINIRPYRYPPTQKDAIEAMLKELLASSVIRHSQSTFSLPVVMVKKKMVVGGCA
ncbi:retrotransposable element Tf2 [Tanacetum coccineum]|uniref:Retrotransposable element Tf2 n=1 Tax=Tanacetum coccineum TaxID=301880 RepID=A0ABQ5C3Y1_9ASTR